MAVKKKLAIKKKKGKLVIHKKAVDTTPDPTEEDILGDDEIDTESPEYKEMAAITQSDKLDAELEKPKPKKKLIKKKQKVVKEVTAQVSVKESNEPEQTVTEHIADVEEVGHMANVGYNMARTINLGDYESVKIAVSINIPSLVDVDEINGNFDFAKEWVEEKLTEVVAEYTDED